VLIATIVGCVLLAAFFAAAEHALAEASRARIDDMIAGTRRTRIDHLLERGDELTLCCGIYRTVFEVGSVVLLTASAMTSEASLTERLVWSGLMVLMACEVIPRLLVARSPEAMLLLMLRPCYWLCLPLLPLAISLLILTRLVRQTSNTPFSEEDEAAEDILSAVTEGEKEGSIGEEQADMIENIIELHDVDVAEIMTPRMDMASVSIDAPIEETIAAALESGHSRLPVFRKTRDEILGILHVRDLIAALVPESGNAPKTYSTQALMRTPYFVPETMPISNLLREFQARKTVFAVVVDEYGGTAGVVTISDIMDTIVGEVRDHDEPPREPNVNTIDEHTLEADARIPVRRLNEDYGTAIPESDEYDTVAGYLCYTLGRVPQKGDAWACDGTRIEVLRADERRVRRLRITVEDGLRIG
jgi:CBS domain containing-hemolysin-like protein